MMDANTTAKGMLRADGRHGRHRRHFARRFSLPVVVLAPADSGHSTPAPDRISGGSGSGSSIHRELLGDLFTPVVSISVAIILFEGALTLSWHEVRHVAGTVRNLLTIGAAVTWFGGSCGALHCRAAVDAGAALRCAHYRHRSDRHRADPAQRTADGQCRVDSALGGYHHRPHRRLDRRRRLRAIVSGAVTPGRTPFSFVMLTAVGTGLGLLAGYIAYELLRRYLVPDYLRDIMVLTLVIVVFVISDGSSTSPAFCRHRHGHLLANTAANFTKCSTSSGKISLLLIASLFILLAANITIADLQMLSWSSLLLLAVVMFVLRPVGVQLSALGSNLSRNERLFFRGLRRGIVAASVSALFAFRLVERSYPEAAILEPLVFLVIVGTVLLQGISAKTFAQRLGISEADPQAS